MARTCKKCNKTHPGVDCDTHETQQAEARATVRRLDAVVARDRVEHPDRFTTR